MGWIECYPKSRLAGTIFCGGVDNPRDSAKRILMLKYKR